MPPYKVSLIPCLIVSCTLGIGNSSFASTSPEKNYYIIPQIDSSLQVEPKITEPFYLTQSLQSPNNPVPPLRSPDRPNPLPDIPENLELLPAPSEILPFLPESAPDESSTFPEAVTGTDVVIVQRFNVQGSTIFSDQQFEELLSPFLNRPLTFTELLQAQNAITDLYVSQGYITSGAFIPAGQVIDDGVVTLQVLEGQIADIRVEGYQRLKPEYVRSRVALTAGPPLNIDELLQALQLLQLNPVIEKISAELISTQNPGENSILIQIQESKSLSLNVQLNNYENPLIGTFQQVIDIQERNLLGYADALNVRYQHAGESSVYEVGYEFPVSPRNTIVALEYSFTDSEIIEYPSSLIAPQSEVHMWTVGIQHPILETVNDRITLGLSLEQRSSQTYIQPEGFPRLPFGFPGTGATENGFTRTTVLQFSQDWQHQTSNQLINLNSRFRLGTSWLGASSNSDPEAPTSDFLAWQGQALWLQRLNPNLLLVTRAAGQVADRPLVISELFGLGGIGSVRGYRKDQIIADNGLLASLELQAPLIRWPEENVVGTIAPFFDYGYVWNSDNQPLSETSLVSIGAGLIFQIGDRFTARLDYALPLINTANTGNSWQESGFLLGIDLQLY